MLQDLSSIQDLGICDFPKIWYFKNGYFIDNKHKDYSSDYLLPTTKSEKFM